MILYYAKKRIITFAEIWYDSRLIPEKETDIVYYRYLEHPYPPPQRKQKHNFTANEAYTIHIDLTQEEDILFSQFRKNTRYEINRAKNKDMIHSDTFYELGEQNEDKLRRYADFKNKSDIIKGRLAGITIDGLKSYGSSFLARYAWLDDNNNALVIHGYIVYKSTVQLLHSASHFRCAEDAEYRNMIGRANRLLHWDDMLYFKKNGMTCYDFGGWSNDKTNADQQKINEFKESFGGIITRQYSSCIPVSLLGKAYVTALNLKKNLKTIIKRKLQYSLKADADKDGADKRT
jgi:lipid II:glycine glycyltransferase (peptidoglycan interpeptide bridge formation enzyme)